MSEDKKPDQTDAYKRDIPLYGFYGKSFFDGKPSQELAEKESKRANHLTSADEELKMIEDGLCRKYGITPPTRWPNRRQDRGESGEQILVIGQTVNDRRNPKLWGIRQEDRTRHCMALGGSGSGKSTLLHALGVEDMWYWRGGLLMEPHGDLAYSLLKTAPPFRIHDVVYLNVLDPLASPGFNPLELPPNPDDAIRQEAVGAVQSLIKKHFNMESNAVQLLKMLTISLNALSFVPGATLLEVMDFYNNEDIRKTVLSFVPEGTQKDEMVHIAENAKMDNLGSLDNRMSRFTSNRYMRHLFGQSRTTINFYNLMNDGAYIICPVSKGGTQDDVFIKFYGSYVVSEVYKAATMREAIKEDDRVNFSLTLDEFQNFMSGDIEGILSEARKYGLQMMLANQYLRQLTPEISAAVKQNCATKLVYNLGPDDATEMARAFGFGITAKDLMSIPKYHVMAAPLVRGGNIKPFISSVFPPISIQSELADVTADLIREASRERYMKPRAEIDAEIKERKERLASGNKDAVIEMMTRKHR